MLKGTWEDLAEEIAQSNSESGVIIAQVDVMKNRQLMKRFSIDRFPVLKYFPGDGTMRSYSGLRDVDEFMEYVLGGYQKDSSEIVPPGPNKLIEAIQLLRQKVHTNSFLRVTLDDFEHIIELRKNAAFVILIIGMIFGFFLSCIFTGKKGEGITQTKSKRD